MNYKIIDKGSFIVVGKQRRITMVDGENFKQVPEFWNDCMNDGSYEWISSKAGKLGVLGVCMDFDKYKDEFIYMIGVENIKERLFLTDMFREIYRQQPGLYLNQSEHCLKLYKILPDGYLQNGCLLQDISMIAHQSLRFILKVIYTLRITNVRFGFLSRSKKRMKMTRTVLSS